MDHLTCDRCGKGLLLDASVRYEAVIEVTAAYDPMELTDDDLAQDYTSEIVRLIARMEEIDEKEAMDQVYRKFSFDLCPQCQKAFIKAPLGNVSP